MKERNSRGQRIDPKVLEKKWELKGELESIEKRRISLGEVDRRVFNIPNLRDVLKKDAEYKRRFGK